ncbi:MAG: ABC transporter permease subunit [Pirellulales bacterium]|jgi:ABC-type dipeptide/oligopeptide/nickel transport system permease component|nr:ABC transporter permease subunit [Pirellulales bacterium]
MIIFLARRFLWFLLTLWVVFTASFFLMRAVPGGPFDGERKLEPDVKQAIERRYRVNEPLVNQYAYHLGMAVGVLTEEGKFRLGLPDLGPSYRIRDYSVNQIIAQGLPVSASLGILALAFSLVVGLSAGIIAALRRQTWVDTSVMLLATTGMAVPNFWMAGVCILLFVFMIPLFPAAGWGSVSNLVLPAFCLGAPYAAYIARLTRTGMLEVLHQDYIRTARAKGLTGSRVILRHALKGALLPVVSFLGPAAAGILTGSLVIEKVFHLSGIGSYFVEAALQRDYPLAMGVVLIYTVVLYMMNVIVDISYAIMDPRIKLQ